MLLCNPKLYKFKTVCPDREFCSKISKNIIFFGKNRGIGKNREFCQIFKFYHIYGLIMLKYISCPNFVEKYWFLRKLYHSLFLLIYKDTGLVYENRSWYLSKKSCKFWGNGASARAIKSETNIELSEFYFYNCKLWWLRNIINLINV